MKKEKKLAFGVAIGIVFGTIIGVATDNIGLWLSLGIAIGAGVGTSLMQQGEKTIKIHPIKVANNWYN